MATVADLITWRDALVEARLSGVRRLRDSNGEEIEYRSDAEMERAIRAANAAIQAANRPPANTFQFNTSKGI